MPLKLTNEVSLMDIIAIGGLLLGGVGVFFGVSTDVSRNTLQIAHNTENLSRIEVKAEKSDRVILEQLRENKSTIKEIRSEAAVGRQHILQKLDKLIDRELNGG